MRHHILVKWKEGQKPDQAAIAKLFEGALTIPGIHGVSLHPNVTDRPNRYDLLILLCMESSALSAFDESATHHQWKDAYGDRIALKAIFDCE